MDNSYTAISDIQMPEVLQSMNMHELNVYQEQGRTKALYITHRAQFVDTRALNYRGLGNGWVGNIGFREVDLFTGEGLFEWWAADHVELTESTISIDSLSGPYPKTWNWL